MSRSQLNRHSTKGPRGNDAGCPILHIDMDAFYASVEVRENPALIGQQVIVGSSRSRGVVLSATYPARALGVHAAMPMSRAIRLAPDAIVVAPRMSLYSEVSQAVMSIFESITPLVQPLSLDEAFLDVSGAGKLFGSPAHIGDVIRERVASEQGITCSVGVAPSMFVAKLATNYAKPDGLHVVPADRVIEFLHPLPLNALWGVGEKTSEQLGRLGLRTVADIANTPLRTLERAIGQVAARHLMDLSWGRDPRHVTPEQLDRSVSAERTFDTDVDDYDVVLAQVLDLSESVARRLRSSELMAKTISIKVRFSDFTTITRSKTLTSTTDVGHDVYACAKRLFTDLHLARTRVRLIGVKASGLVPLQEGSIQLEFSERVAGWREAEQTMDQVADKFGKTLVKPARLFGSGQNE